MASFAATKTSARAETAVATGSKTWAWVGLGSAVLGIVVTWIVQFLSSEDALKSGGQVLVDDLKSGNTEAIYRISSGVGFILVGALIVYSIGLYKHLNAKAGGKSSLPAIIAGSFLVTAAVFAITMSFRAQVFDGLTYYTADTANHVAVQRLQQDSVLTSWAVLYAGIIAVAIGGIKGTLFPKGLGIFSAVVLVPMTLLLLGGVAFPAGAMVALPWFLVFAIWGVRQPVLE